MKIILSGGGTGGHLFPAIALAETFKEKDFRNEIIFIGSKKGLEAEILLRYGFHLETLDVTAVKGKGFLNRLHAVFKALNGTFKSMKIIRKYKPDIAVGTGGYTTFSVIAAAKIMKVKTAILEQNALPGAANRYLGIFADRIFVAFPHAKKYFPANKVVISGNPVRKEILGLRVKGQGLWNDKETEKHTPRFPVSPIHTFTILIFGGSQGAKAVNSLVLEAVEYLSSSPCFKHAGTGFNQKPSALKIIHQTGRDDYERVKNTYDRFHIPNFKFQVFNFIDDMAEAYKEADLVICRSGATTIAEITVLGKASILIPYPFAADNHQEVNARCLSDKGAAVMLKQEGLDGKKLADSIIGLYKDSAKIKDIEEGARLLGTPHAGSLIVEDICRTMHV